MKQLDPNDTIAIGFSVQYQLDDGRNLAFSSCIDAECDPALLNAALDKLVDAAERQQARVKVPKLRKELERMEAGHQRAMEDMFRLDQEAELANTAWKNRFNGEGRRGEYKMSAAQLNEKNKRDADRTNAEITFKRYQEEIALRKAELEEMTVAISSAADSRSGVPNG
jgi:hypothetical protein